MQWWAILLFLLSSCASNIKVKTPASYFVTPESSGELGKGNVAIHQLSGTEGTFDFAPGSTSEELKLGTNSDAFGATAQVGVFHFLDFVYRTGTHTPEMFGVKTQISGNHKNESKKGDESWGLLFMAGSSKYETDDGSNLGIQISSGADMTFKRTHTAVHLGLLYGKRLEDYWLLYGHYGESRNTVHGEIAYEGNALDGEQARYYTKIHNYTVGTRFEKEEIALLGELTLQDVKWTYTQRQYFYLISLGVAFNWY